MPRSSARRTRGSRGWRGRDQPPVLRRRLGQNPPRYPELVCDVWLARAAGSTRCAATSDDVIARICSWVIGLPKIA